MCSNSLAQELRENKLNASLGINFKYNGSLNHNLDKVWIVTIIKLPKFSDIHMPSKNINSNCSFIQKANFNTAGNEEKEIKHTLCFFCISLHPFIDLIKKEEKHYRDTIEKLLEEDIQFALKSKESQTLRYKRALAGLFPAL